MLRTSCSSIGCIITSSMLQGENLVETCHSPEHIEKYKTKLEPFKDLKDYQELSTMCQRNIKIIENLIKENKFKKYHKMKL